VLLRDAAFDELIGELRLEFDAAVGQEIGVEHHDFRAPPAIFSSSSPTRPPAAGVEAALAAAPTRRSAPRDRCQAAVDPAVNSLTAAR
jgi:hypothetical protein